MAKSPSVNLIERNIASFATTTSDTTVAVVGYATKGPIGTATKVTSFKEFRQKFGYPTSLGFSSLAVQRAFNQGNSLIFYRVAETEGSDAAVASKILVKNTVDELESYQEFTRITDVLQGTPNYTNGVEYSFNIAYDAVDKPIYMRSPASGRWSLNDMLDQISDQISATSGYQEFTDKNLLSLSTTSYFFKLSVDSVEKNNFMVDVVANDTIESLASKIRTAIYGGSRAYNNYALTTPKANVDTALSLSSSKYNFGIKTLSGASSFTKVVVSNITANTTLRQLAAIINTEFIRRGIQLICLPEAGGLYFFAKDYTSTSYAAIDSGTDRSAFGEGTDLFAALGAGSIASVAARVAGFSENAVSVSVDSYTGRIKITSASTGSSSVITIGTAGLVSTFTNLGLEDANNGLGVEVAKDGYAAIAVTATKDVTSKKIRISKTGETGALTDFITDGATGFNFLTLMPVDDSVTGHVGTTTATTDVIVFSSKETGSSTTNIAVEKSSAVNPVDSTTVHTVKVFYDGELKETFEDVSLTITDENYFANKINDTVENGGSEWVSVEVFNNDSNSTVTFPNGTYQLGTAADSTSIAYTSDMDATNLQIYDYVVGTDGIPLSGGEDLFITALSSTNDLANQDVFNYHILVTPDNNEEVVQDAAIALAEIRKDFVYLVDPPFGLSYDQVRDWHNGTGNYGRSNAVSSSYAAIYWPWLKDYDSYSKKYVWVPPSVFVTEKFLEIDRTYKPWSAPAGETRGKLLANDSEYSPSFNEREEIYGDFNCINPIVDFVSKGLIIFGQKTASRENVASNRINVRRMVIYVKKLIKSALDSMLFEPHDANSWQRATSLINSILENVRQNGGIAEYAVVIDATTNTADLIAQQIMSGIVKIVPTGTIEVIELNINVYKSGSAID